MFKEPIITALAERAARVRVLLATPGSSYLAEIEAIESRSRRGQIVGEIENTKALLEEIAEQTGVRVPPGRMAGTIELGFYNTQGRCSLILCDGAWGKLTPYLPPSRGVEVPSLVLTSADGGLLRRAMAHFEAVWQAVSAEGATEFVPAGSPRRAPRRAGTDAKRRRPVSGA